MRLATTPTRCRTSRLRKPCEQEPGGGWEGKFLFCNFLCCLCFLSKSLVQGKRKSEAASAAGRGAHYLGGPSGRGISSVRHTVVRCDVIFCFIKKSFKHVTKLCLIKTESMLRGFFCSPAAGAKSRFSHSALSLFKYSYPSGPSFKC